MYSCCGTQPTGSTLTDTPYVCWINFPGLVAPGVSHQGDELRCQGLEARLAYAI